MKASRADSEAWRCPEPEASDQVGGWGQSSRHLTKTFISFLPGVLGSCPLGRVCGTEAPEQEIQCFCCQLPSTGALLPSCWQVFSANSGDVQREEAGGEHLRPLLGRAE